MVPAAGTLTLRDRVPAVSNCTHAVQFCIAVTDCDHWPTVYVACITLFLLLWKIGEQNVWSLKQNLRCDIWFEICR